MHLYLIFEQKIKAPDRSGLISSYMQNLAIIKDSISFGFGSWNIDWITCSRVIADHSSHTNYYYYYYLLPKVLGSADPKTYLDLGLKSYMGR